MKHYTDHQFGLFGFQKPTSKVPISREQVLKVKELITKKDGKGAAAILRDIRYKLQAFESRITVAQTENE